jgi:hypothetical protein
MQFPLQQSEGALQAAPFAWHMGPSLVEASTSLGHPRGTHSWSTQALRHGLLPSEHIPRHEAAGLTGQSLTVLHAARHAAQVPSRQPKQFPLTQTAASPHRPFVQGPEGSGRSWQLATLTHAPPPNDWFRQPCPAPQGPLLLPQ